MKTLITGLIAILATQSALAGDIRIPKTITCKPSFDLQNGEQYFLRPRKVDEILYKLRLDLGDERLRQALGEPALRSLEQYSKLNDGQIHANIYVAAAAAGAAASIVDYVWDRYVGNGSKNDRIVREDFFDIRPSIQEGSLPAPSLPKHLGTPLYTGFKPPRHPNLDPVALTPAVGTAVVGAVAYKAVEYSMRKAFGEQTAPEQFDVRAFDLQP